jgi:ATP-binding cassette subfamily B protein
VENNEKLTWNEYFSFIFWTTKTLFSLLPFLTSLKVLVAIFNQLSPVIYSIFFAYFIDSLISLQNNPDWNRIIIIMSVFFIYYALTTVNDSIESHLNRVYELKGRFAFREMLYLHLQRIGIQTLEDSEIENKIHRASENSYSFIFYFDRIAGVISQFISVVVTGSMLFYIQPLILPVLIIVVLPRMLVYNYYVKKDWELNIAQTEGFRRSLEDVQVLTQVKKLHEVIITNSFDFFANRLKVFNKQYIGGIESLSFQKNLYSGTLQLLATVAMFGTLAYFIREFINNELTIGNLTLQFRNVTLFAGTLSSMMATLTRLSESGLKIHELRHVFLLKPQIQDGDIELPKLNKAPTVKLDNVTFTYPKAGTPVLKNINLSFKPGEKIAIVGHNGAGKTTLVRLLSRFYVPEQGEITINDIKLNDIKIDSWYKNMGVLFQEYNTYEQLNLRDNVLVGDATQEATDDKIKTALHNANAIDFVNDYKSGLDQVLSVKYRTGTRPSTGQWQKIAIARFLYRKAPFVIFDEPTASIDPVSEAKIFKNIYDHFKDKTVIIISHRFSTVRRADRILVLDHGEIKEQGTHQELMAQKGIYAAAFSLQADAYK